jgi:ABC-2 type transport system permease protein
VSSLLRFALRSHRTGAIAMALISGLGGLLNAFGFTQIAGATHAERLAFAHQMELIGKQFSYILPPPVQLDTMGGYMTWRDFSSIAVAYGVWAVLAATGAARGDEERRLTELWLANGASRVRWLTGRATGFILAASASIAVMTAITAAAAAAAGDPLPIGALALEAIMFAGLTICAFGIGLIVAQLFIARRAAALTASGALIFLFLVNSAVRSGVDVGAAKWFSPFYYFDRSTPLLEGGTFDLAATAALFAIGAIFMALATLAFVLRDVGGTLIAGRARTTTPTARPSRDPLLRVPVLAAVDQQRGWIAGWTIALSVLAYFLVSITKVLADAMMAIPGLQQYFAATGIRGYSDFVGIIWFGTVLLILAIFVVVQVSGWAADDGDGRLELMLAQPVSRPRIVVERIAALLVGVAIIAGVSTSATYIAANANGIGLPAARTALAGLLMVPVAFALGGIGLAVVSWRPRIAVAVLGIVTALSYFTEQFVPIFGWPEWTVKTSVFALYGMPLSKDDWPGIGILIGIGLAGTAIATLAMQRRDVGA